MSDFISLEELKKLDPKTLNKMWMAGKFPFDFVPTCRRCVTMHKYHYNETDCIHKDFIASAQILPKYAQIVEEIGQNLEAIYSLRLFYKDLYASNPPEIESEPEKEVPCQLNSSK